MLKYNFNATLLKSHFDMGAIFFFHKQMDKLGWSSIYLRISQFEPEIMLHGMLKFLITEFDMNTAMVSLTFEILWVAWFYVLESY